MKFYKIYVFPKVTYCSSIYSLISVNNIDQIEKIQKYFTKRLYLRLYPKTAIPKYSDRLVLFKLDLLEIHFIKRDLCTLYRLVNNILEIPGLHLPRSTRLPNRLQVPSVRSTADRSFYLHRTIMIWNKFLSYTQFTSFVQFKSFLNTLHFDSVYKGSALKAR